MSYTNPLGHPQGVPHKVTNLLRQVMIAELVAINGYQNHILTSNITVINEAWYHIMLDEKSHYIIALDLLRKYDSVEYKYFMTPHELNVGTDSMQNVLNLHNTSNTKSGSNTQGVSNIQNISNTKSGTNAQNASNIQNISNTKGVPNTPNASNVQNAPNVHSGQGKHSSGKKSLALSSQAERIAIYDKPLILNNVREDIKGELEAIILYEDEIAEIQQKDIRIALQKIIDDEKEHTEHLTQVLLHFDPDPYKS